MTDEYSFVNDNLAAIRENIAEEADKCGRNAEDIRIMAVTKTVAPEIVNRAVELGVTLLGENRVQEFLSKQEAYDRSAEIHFIGHLQTNKVKYIIEPMTMIQSVDSIKLAQEINRLASAHNKTMDILCEVNIGGEESKSGIAPDGLLELIEAAVSMENLRVRGLMTIPPPASGDIFLGRMEELFHKIKDTTSAGSEMDVLSMGMTHDYADAVRHGSTLVRIGTGLFGARDYSKK
ncbi:MAG: YggS family pyridoxal phosphate-dependent enzyme [Ruminococcus sp.]|nr:YggS family pyridoxal phosphate-dependent enzyme [Ruminococcus sp.]